MTQHKLAYYKDGYAQVAYCENCSAEGLLLTENCPEKVIVKFENSLDEKDQTAK